MVMIAATLANGRSIAFEIDTRAEGHAYFLFSIRKCGSSVFNSMAHALAVANRRNFVNVGGTFFNSNVLARDYVNDSGVLSILHAGNVYGGFRDMPGILRTSDLFRQSPKLLMVRDPRDALVSQYFSNAYSHPIPETTGDNVQVVELMQRQRAEALAMGVETYVISHARGMKRTMMAYRRVAADPSTTILKYEEYIFDKPALMRIVCERIGWQIDEALIGEIMTWADVRPGQEAPTAFIRKVTPGDHREKLSAEAVENINAVLAPAMDLFGYGR